LVEVPATLATVGTEPTKRLTGKQACNLQIFDLVTIHAWCFIKLKLEL